MKNPRSWVARRLAGVRRYFRRHPRLAAARLVALRVLAVVVALEVLYLVVANLFLQTALTKRLLNGATDQLRLDYRSAYTLLPTRLHVRGLWLRLEDYNVQFQLQIERADVEVSASALFGKKFHATRVRAEGVQYRFRHKLHEVDDAAARVAAYPPIDGLPDPPLYRGPKSPPIPDEQYDLWEIQIDDVIADVRELWFMEYRYRGPARVAGSFLLRPTRFVRVEPAHLSLDGGTLTLGETAVASRVKGNIDCDIPGLDVKYASGLQPLRGVSADVRLELEGTDLSFVQAYLGRAPAAAVEGEARISVDAHVRRGLLEPKSHVTVTADRLRVSHPLGELEGPVRAVAGVPEEGERLVVRVEAARLLAKPNRGAEPPTLSDARADVTFAPADLALPIRRESASLKIGELRIPALEWLAPWLGDAKKLAGAATLAADVWRAEAKGSGGWLTLDAKAASLRSASFDVSGDANGRIDFTAPAGAGEAFTIARGSLEAERVRVRLEDKRAALDRVMLQTRDWKVTQVAPFGTQGTVDVQASPAREALGLWLGSDMLRGIAAEALDLGRLDARVAVWISGGERRVELLRASSGKLSVRGYLHAAAPQRDQGAFLVSAGPVNVGIRVTDGDVDTKPFVGDDWLGSTK